MPQYYSKARKPAVVLFISLTVAAMTGCGGAGKNPSPPPVGANPAVIVVNPAALDFGSVPVGSQKTGSVTMSNSRGSTATISQITTTGAGFSIISAPPLPLVLAVGQSSTLTVAFKPTSSGPASSSVSVLINGLTSAVTETLSGNGVASGQLGVNPSAMVFGNVPLGTSQSQTGSLTAGNLDVAVSSASWNGTGYSLSGITFPVTIPAGQTIPFIVTFAPQTTSNSPGNVVFVSNAANSPATETLSGSGLQPPHTVDLAWTASISSVIGYNIYRGSQSGGPYTRLNSALQPATAYSDNSIQSGATYFYVITSVDGSLAESDFSNESMATIPNP